MRSIAKLSSGPGLFNINEPVIFGLPVMLNPVMAILFIVTPLVTGTIGYIATATGFAGKAVVMVPWTTPPIVNAWLSTAGSMGLSSHSSSVLLSLFSSIYLLSSYPTGSQKQHLIQNRRRAHE